MINDSVRNGGLEIKGEKKSIWRKRCRSGVPLSQWPITLDLLNFKFFFSNADVISFYFEIHHRNLLFQSNRIKIKIPLNSQLWILLNFSITNSFHPPKCNLLHVLLNLDYPFQGSTSLVNANPIFFFFLTSQWSFNVSYSTKAFNLPLSIPIP